jgi:two-component system chemotaxis response regulator CheB
MPHDDASRQGRGNGRELARAFPVARHDIVVIGASSGGVEALTRMFSALPESFPAAVFVVLHVRPDAPSHLPAILNRAGPLPAAHAVDQEPIRRGRVYVAPPGMQTYVHQGRIGVRRGPQENGHRPAIDPLFRTAAHFYGSRVIGVVLSGALDDGSAGLLAIKRAGGLTLVQDPEEAMVPTMPASALRVVQADLVTGVDGLAAALIDLVSRDADAAEMHQEVPLETVEEATRPSEAFRSDQLGRPSQFVCPDCSGTLYEIEDGPGLRFRCRVGHAFSEEAMDRAQDGSVERALWTALRTLEERSALMNRLADFARRRHLTAAASAYEQKAKSIERDVASLHALITAGQAVVAVTE